jgi:phosphate acetyltransferase
MTPSLPETAWPLGDRLLSRCRGLEPVPTAVVHPCDPVAIQSAAAAAAAGLIAPVLVGPEAKIRAAAEAGSVDISDFELIATPHSHAAAARAVALVRAGGAQLLMKGSLHTDELMHEVLAIDTGLRTARRVSHVYLMQTDSYPKPLLITDGAINIAPDLDAMRDIVQNAIDLAHVLGIPAPKVAILSAVETVSARLPSTVDAAALCKMADRGQITGGVLDGPLAFDNAINPAAAAQKGIVSAVAGMADILVVPDLIAGNILAKQLTFLGGAQAAGVVLGARVPIILTSRADSERAHVVSCAMAVLVAEGAGLVVRAPPRALHA